MTDACAREDLVNRKISWLLWRIPLAAIVLGIALDPPARTLLWTPAFLVSGVACAVNAVRCRRVHCYISGPVFLLAAAATLMLYFEVAPLRWSWIGIGVVVGTLLAYLPEAIRGKYLGKAKSA